jgi:hypothetical protein
MDFHFHRIIDFLRKHAPSAPLAECVTLANEFQTLNDGDYYHKCIIAILASRLLADNGCVLPEFSVGRPAWQVALKELQQCHAWVVCGPMSGAMEKLLCEFDAKGQPKK